MSNAANTIEIMTVASGLGGGEQFKAENVFSDRMWRNMIRIPGFIARQAGFKQGDRVSAVYDKINHNYIIYHDVKGRKIMPAAYDRMGFDVPFALGQTPGFDKPFVVAQYSYDLDGITLHGVDVDLVRNPRETAKVTDLVRKAINLRQYDDVRTLFAMNNARKVVTTDGHTLRKIAIGLQALIDEEIAKRESAAEEVQPPVEDVAPTTVEEPTIPEKTVESPAGAHLYVCLGLALEFVTLSGIEAPRTRGMAQLALTGYESTQDYRCLLTPAVMLWDAASAAGYGNASSISALGRALKDISAS